MTISRITMSILSFSCMYMLSASQAASTEIQPSLATQRNTPATALLQTEEDALFSSLEKQICAFQDSLTQSRETLDTLDKRLCPFFWFSADSIKQNLARRTSNSLTLEQFVDKFTALQNDFRTTIQNVEKCFQVAQSASAINDSCKTAAETKEAPRKPLNNISLHPHGKHPKA